MNQNLLSLYPWLNGILEATGTRRTKILMVADGDIDFGHQQFGLSELLKALGRGDTPSDELSIFTAHRGPKKEGRVAEDYDFQFKPATFGIEKYDQVWLFGFLGQDDKFAAYRLSDEELKVLSEFMNKGGGVFATGDHADLGYALCGRVPRVRLMRKWRSRAIEETPPLPKACRNLLAPPVDTERRLDSLREGRDAGFQFSDEGDDIPQTIIPTIFNRLSLKHVPHQLLEHNHSMIRVLPDHMHEGECIVPAPECLNAKLKFGDGPEFDEFPVTPRRRIVPVLVATAFSVGGHSRDRVISEIEPPVTPRSYGAICAYEGQDTGQAIGNVVVDSSFHHFVDINLDGTGTKFNKGFYDAAGKPTKDYESIKQYYRNIVTWLTPGPQRFLLTLNILLSVRYMYPLSEEIPLGADPERFDDILALGALTRRAIAALFSPAIAIECARTLLEVKQAPDELKELINPWLPPPDPPDPADRFDKLIDAGVVIDAILGQWMCEFTKRFPDDPYAAREKISELALKEANFKSRENLEESAIKALVDDLVGPTVDALGQFVIESRRRIGGGDHATRSEISLARVDKLSPKEDAMAFKCNAPLLFPWVSQIKRPGAAQFEPDGRMTVDSTDSDGNFIGSHVDDRVLIAGICGAAAGDECRDEDLCSITITRLVQEQGQLHVRAYTGQFKRVTLPTGQDAYQTINGKYTQTPIPLASRITLAAEDGDWIGTKPIPV